MAKKIVKFMDTSFRDGFQSVFGARVFTKDFIPALEAAVAAGTKYFEAGGGARFQTLYFYCNEDAFDMMDAFRTAVGPDINLQTLSRGISVVGLESQSSDIIDLHAKMFKKHGMTTIRNFDALNDVNNLIYSGECITNAGLKHQVSVTMMALPPGCTGAHTADFYIQNLQDILSSGVPFDSIVFKDASGTSTPTVVYETIKTARSILGSEMHIHFHSHETAGISILQYKAALDAGADAIDLAMAPVSGGTSQPDIITMWHALRGTDFDLDIDIEKIIEAQKIFKECLADYFIPPESRTVESMIPFSPMPGGALTANTQMMRDNGILNRFPEVIDAMRETVSRGGFGTSVTPVSQFYFQQAFNNIMFGPWEKIADGYGKMVLGYFGKTPMPADPEIIAIAAKQLNLEPTTQDPRTLNDADPTKGIEATKKLISEANLPTTDENIFITATCKEKGIAFLKGEAKINVRKIQIKADSSQEQQNASTHYTVNINQKDYDVQLENNKAIVDGETYNIDVKESSSQKPKTNVSKMTDAHLITSPLPGSIFKLKMNVGDKVKEGDILMILEAMKMETEIKSSHDGTIAAINVSVGDQVTVDQVLASIN